MRDILEQNPGFQNIAAILLGVLVVFAAWAKGAHDIWAATLVTCFSIVLAAAVLINAGWGSNSPGVRLRGIPTFLLVLAIFFISHHQSVRPEESYLELMDWVAAALLFFVSINIFHQEASLRLFSGTVSVIFFVEGITAVLQKLGFGPPILLEEPAGTLLNANFASAFALLWAPVIFFRWRENQTPRHKIPIYWSVVGLCLVTGLILASSMSAVACLLLGLPFLIYIGKIKSLVKSRPRLIWITATVIIIIVSALVWYKYSQLYRWTYRGQWAPPTSRLTWWMSGLNIWKDHFWWGTGPGTFGSAYLAYKIGTGQNTLFAHSFIISLLSETGLLGFLAVLGLSLSVFWRSRRYVLDRARIPFFAGFVLFMLFGLINISYELMVNLLTASIFVGILVAAGPPSHFQIRRSILVVMTAMALISLVYVGAPFLASQNVAAGNEELELRNWPQAEAEYRDAISLDESSSQAYEGLARALVAQGRFDEAVMAQMKAIQNNRLSGMAWWALGRIYELAGDKINARAATHQALQYHRTNPHFQADLERLQAN